MTRVSTTEEDVRINIESRLEMRRAIDEVCPRSTSSDHTNFSGECVRGGRLIVGMTMEQFAKNAKLAEKMRNKAHW